MKNNHFYSFSILLSKIFIFFMQKIDPKNKKISPAIAMLNSHTLAFSICVNTQPITPNAPTHKIPSQNLKYPNSSLVLSICAIANLNTSATNINKQSNRPQTNQGKNYRNHFFTPFLEILRKYYRKHINQARTLQ